MFNLASVLIPFTIEKSWSNYHHGKNESNDSHLNCMANANFKDYIKSENVLVEFMSWLKIYIF
jgi:hypothetical protein